MPEIFVFIFVFVLVIGVSWVIIPVLNKKISPPKRKKSTYNNTSDYQNSSQANSDNGDYSGENDNDSSTDSDGIFSDENNIEKKYAKILNLKGKVNISDIEKGYRKIIKKYHPDKVAMMGDELKDLAEKRTKEINEAYDYFKKKYS